MLQITDVTIRSKIYLCEMRSSSPSTYKDIGIDYMFLKMNEIQVDLYICV